MLLMSYLQEYVSSKTNDINVKLCNMKARINESKTLIKHIHATENANSIV